ncbi:hypothetical protein EHYA_06864 [Embleya hyalina]|uniref:Uncharacterized protein n=1 Tax=Embleya hyalina TaxID=516124 RepID=A0A401YX51_9ACTN|nr:hypothetical protein EHYA_06864 [Embleya hyalina]
MSMNSAPRVRAGTTRGYTSVSANGSAVNW